MKLMKHRLRIGYRHVIARDQLVLFYAQAMNDYRSSFSEEDITFAYWERIQLNQHIHDLYGTTHIIPTPIPFPTLAIAQESRSPSPTAFFLGLELAAFAEEEERIRGPNTMDLITVPSTPRLRFDVIRGEMVPYHRTDSMAEYVSIFSLPSFRLTYARQSYAMDETFDETFGMHDPMESIIDESVQREIIASEEDEWAREIDELLANEGEMREVNEMLANEADMVMLD